MNIPLKNSKYALIFCKNSPKLILNHYCAVIMSEKDLSWDNQTLVFEETEQQIKEPSMYKVLIINDDFTPMDFVIDVLSRFFRMDQERATQVMMHVHTRGKGLCGIFTHEIAETKMLLANQYAKENSHPLLCVMESV